MKLANYALTFAAMLSSVSPAFAQQQPVQWRYSFDPAGVATATYPGNVVINGDFSTAGEVTDATFFGIDAANTAAANSAGMQRAFNDTANRTVQFGPGVINLTCQQYTAASSLSLQGAGNGSTILRFPAGCNFTGNVFAWISRSNVKVQNLTIDFNTPAASASLSVGLAFLSYSGNTNNLLVSNNRIINATSPNFVVGIGANGGFTYRNVNVVENFISLTAPALTQNQCIALTTVGGTGFIPGGNISYNVCENTGIQADGLYTRIIGNEAYGYRFGTGVFTSYQTGTVPKLSATSRYCVIANNVFHDTIAGLDVNNTPAGGIENNCVGSVVSGNVMYNLGGYGVLNYGADSVYIGNMAWNNGKQGSTGASGILQQAGFALSNNGTGSTAYNSENVTMIGNKAWDDGTGTQVYGYADFVGSTLRTVLKGNDFTNSPQEIVTSAGSQAASSDGYIRKNSTLAGTVTTMDFTNLPIASYRRWILSCRDLNPVTAAIGRITFGRGTPTPTWLTAAGYTVNQMQNVSGTPTGSNTTTATEIQIGTVNWDTSQALPGQFTATIGRLDGTAGGKPMAWTGAYRAGLNYTVTTGAGAWQSDSLAIDAIRFNFGGVAFSGVCVLEGTL